MSTLNYVKLFDGLWELPSHCKFTGNNTNQYKLGNNVICNKQTFKQRFSEFTHGLFDEYTWPENLYLTGPTILALTGKYSYSHSI